MKIKIKQFAVSDKDKKTFSDAEKAYKGVGKLGVSSRRVHVTYDKKGKKPSTSDIERALKDGKVTLIKLGKEVEDIPARGYEDTKRTVIYDVIQNSAPKQFAASSQDDYEKKQKAKSAYTGSGRLKFFPNGVGVIYNKNDKKPSVSDVEKALNNAGIKEKLDKSSGIEKDNTRNKDEKNINWFWQNSAPRQFAQSEVEMTLDKFCSKYLPYEFGWASTKTIEGNFLAPFLKKSGKVILTNDSEMAMDYIPMNDAVSEFGSQDGDQIMVYYSNLKSISAIVGIDKKMNISIWSAN